MKRQEIAVTVNQSSANSQIKWAEGALCMNHSTATTTKTPPKVSIGLPVYNGERYLPESIESLLAQDFTDFELLIADNASTDRTWDICQEYAARDQRIRIHRQQKNVGAMANFEFVLANTTAPYFMWHAHDDVRASSCLQESVRFLDSHPDYVLCATGNTVIDEPGRRLLYSLPYDFSWDDDDPVSRFGKCLETYGQCHAIYGVFKRETLEQLFPSPRTESYSDTIAVLRTCLAGKCGHIKEPLRHFRAQRFQSMIEAIEHYPRTLFGPGFKVRLFPHTRGCQVMISHILHFSGLDFAQKLALVRLTLRRGPFSNFLQADTDHFVKVVLTRSETTYSLARALKRWITKLLHSHAN